MAGLAIVALPQEDDYVNKISSEKIPHCTILFLGDPNNPKTPLIDDFVQHAVNIAEIGPFGFEVDYRGTLGPDNADVLFFKRGWSCKRIDEFRGQLLKNNAIRDAYDSTPQFDGPWIPHLTLGYPQTPAKPDNRDFPGIRWVEFDRIAIWHGNFTGPEFRLQYNYDTNIEEVAVGMSAERGRDFLEHHGVKGMKWGRRGAGRSASPTPATATSVVNKGLKSKTKIKTKGGQAHPAHADAVKAALSKQKLKKSGHAALSNKELGDLATRMNLEQQVSRLSAQEKGGKKFVKKTLRETGANQTRQVINAQAAKKVAKLGLAAA